MSFAIAGRADRKKKSRRGCNKIRPQLEHQNRLSAGDREQHMGRSAPIRPTASSSCPNAGSSSEPSPGSADAEGSPRIGSASIARRSPSSSSRLSASCCENYAIQDDVSGQTLSASTAAKAGVAALSAALGEELLLGLRQRSLAAALSATAAAFFSQRHAATGRRVSRPQIWGHPRGVSSRLTLRPPRKDQ
jgi:hypothetical protein